jgi:protein SCO1/2
MLVRVLPRILISLFAAALAVGFVGVLHRRSAEIDDLGPVGDFTFVERSGRPVTQADQAGQVWVVGCFFTCCTESCPALNASMARLQEELAGVPDARLVSLTVDPTNDTPAKLTEYAGHFGALPDRWLFLTGSPSEVESFVHGRLHLGVEANPSAPAGSRVMHSSKLTVIDKKGQIRGYFDAVGEFAPHDLGRLKEVVTELARGAQ